MGGSISTTNSVGIGQFVSGEWAVNIENLGAYGLVKVGNDGAGPTVTLDGGSGSIVAAGDISALSHTTTSDRRLKKEYPTIE